MRNNTSNDTTTCSTTVISRVSNSTYYSEYIIITQTKLTTNMYVHVYTKYMYMYYKVWSEICQ